MSKAREAFLQAAAHIEAHPEQYNFYKHHIPKTIHDAQACLLGWAGYFYDAERWSGLNTVSPIHNFSREVLGHEPTIFYERLRYISPLFSLIEQRAGAKDWANDSKIAANTLREFAETL